MRVLVIGGTRFIGRSLVCELVDAGHEVAIVHRGSSEPDDLPEVRHIHVDRDEIASMRREIDDFDPDVVCDNIAAFGRHATTTVEALGDRRYVVVSSMDVYRAYGSLLDQGVRRPESRPATPLDPRHAGRMTDPVPVDETSPVREQRYPYRGQIEGMDDYDKLDVEDVYLERGATILRLPMVYGPRDGQRREEFVLRRVRAGRDRIPVGAGTWLGTKGYVDDVARGIRLAIETGDLAGEILNLGESRTYPMGMWTQMILDAAGATAELVRVADDALPADLAMTGTIPQHLLVDSSKARGLLGWTDTPAAEALRSSVSWHLDHPPPEASDDFTADDEALARP